MTAGGPGKQFPGPPAIFLLAAALMAMGTSGRVTYRALSKSASACGFGRQGYALYRRAGGERPHSGSLVVMDEGGGNPTFPAWGRAGPADLRPGRLRWSWPRRSAPPRPLHGLDEGQGHRPGVEPCPVCCGTLAAVLVMEPPSVALRCWPRWAGRGLGLLRAFLGCPGALHGGQGMEDSMKLPPSFQAVRLRPVRSRWSCPHGSAPPRPFPGLDGDRGTPPGAQIGHIPRRCPVGDASSMQNAEPGPPEFSHGGIFLAHEGARGIRRPVSETFLGWGRVSPYRATCARMAACGCAPAHKHPSADVASRQKTCEKSAKNPPLFCIS